MSSEDIPQTEIDHRVEAMRTLARQITGTWLELKLDDPEKMQAFAHNILEGNLHAFFEQAFERMADGVGLSTVADAAFRQWLDTGHSLPASRGPDLLRKIDAIFSHSDVKDAIAGDLAKVRAQVYRMRATGHTWQEISKSLGLSVAQAKKFHSNSEARLAILRAELRLYEPTDD